ncbi:dicarboxylate/amino acid:cation symporter [Ferdinandcohnia quinoae]|uniref:Dicarboxylate/amino acid:cation symporter n=1 Tax=Fredinandcohnia quinoae TaxID=2918902 RepID=A0AAW5E8C3_9BACI|nr:dicarboxylate/amino acid:cation symporter [Fredinandcohnia sp. SECRCQ15]MCH1626271.1 dicarboxylate/amino acid:cation symporter [Fredinandcohnia sp. SECRCQ15]
MSLTKKILYALLLGAVVGIILNLTAPEFFTHINKWLFVPLGQIFLNLIKMLVVPIVFFSITLGVAGLGDPKKLGRIGAKTIVYFLLTTTIAIIIGISLAFIVQPGSGGGFDTEGVKYEGTTEAPPVVETLLNIIPTNPVAAMTEGNMLQIIAFSVFIGFALTILGNKTKGILNLFEQANDIMMYLVNLVMKVAPYGTFGLIATAIGSQGYDAIKAMAAYFLVVVAALFIHAAVTYGGTVALVKRSPIEFFKGFFPAMTVAFSTSSSNATLPVSMETAQKNLKVPEPISSFVQPLGATINMDGTAIMQGVATIFIAQAWGVDLSITQILMVILTAVLASVGTAGVPGVGLIMLAMVLDSVGLPVAGIGLIIGIDRLLDMTRTAVNITGDAACAVYVAETEKKHMDVTKTA